MPTPEEPGPDWRDFTLLWSASAASHLGYWCSTTANPLLALLLTHSPVFAGWVGAASTAPALLMYLPAGWFVDRFDRRRLMFVGQVGRLLALTLLICALVSEWQMAAPLLIVTAFCEGTFQVLYNATAITAVQRVVDTAELPSALARNEAGWHLALMTGKPLGGFLFGLHRALPYSVSLLTTIWSIARLRAMNNKHYQAHDADKSLGEVPENSKISIRNAVGELKRHSFLSTVIVVCAVSNFFFQTVVLSLVVLAEQQHMSSATIGLLLATSGIGGLVGSIVAPRARRHIRDEWTIIKAFAATWTALVLVVAISGDPAVGLLAWGCLSVTGGFLNVAIVTYQTREVPQYMLGRVIGISRFVTSGAVPLGALSAGYIVALLQPRRAAWPVFVLMFSMLIVLLVRFRPGRSPHTYSDEPADRTVGIVDPPRSSAEIPEGTREPVTAQ